MKVKLWQRIAAIGKIKWQKNIKLNTDKLKNVFTAWEYKKEIEEYLDDTDIEEQTIDMTWMHIKQSIYKALKNAMGFYTKRIRTEECDDQCKDAA